MKIIFISLFALLFAGQVIRGQCIPFAPATVFDSLACNAGNSKTISNVPTGSVIKLIVTTPVYVSIDLCATNPGTGPYPEGTNDSYITILDSNSAFAGVVDKFDDGCTNMGGNGYGPSVGSVRFDNAGSYYIYLTEYAGGDFCIADGANSNYIIDLNVTAALSTTNDECTQPLELALNIPVYTTTGGLTLNAAVEGAGDTSLGISAFCGLPNGFKLTSVSWFSFHAPAAGAYVFYAQNLSSSNNQWHLDVTFFPAGDVSCTDINQTVFTNAICKTISFQRDSAILDLPDSGNYLIPVGAFDSGDDFTFIITNAAVKPACQDANVGTVTTARTSYDVVDSIIDVTFSGATNVSQVGNLFGYYALLADGPIEDLNNYAADTNLLQAGRFDPVNTQFTVKNILASYPSGGTFYYYFVAANDVALYSDQTELIDFSCADTALIIFEVKAPINISGSIHSEFSTPIPGVTLQVTGSHNQSIITANDGLYDIDVPAGGNYTVTPSKNNDVTTSNGITTLDILFIQRQIIATQNLSTAYKVIAADVNASTTVTTLDIVLIRSVILANTTTFPNSKLWAFVRSEFVFSDPQHPFPYANFRSYNNIIENQSSQDFIGIKLGDVNNSWDPNALKASAVGEVQLMMDEYQVMPGDEITVPVKVKDFKAISGYQFTLSWDAKVLSLLAVDNKSLNGFYGENKTSEGYLTTSWNDEMTKAVTLDDDAVAFELKFKVVGAARTQSAIKIGSEVTVSEAYNENLDLLNITPTNGMVKVGDVNGFHLSQGWSPCNLQVIPNPFSNTTSIIFSIPKDETVSIVIYDLLGKEIKHIKSDYKAGEHTLEWKGDNDSGSLLSKGLYHVRMVTGNEAKAVKVAIIR